MNVLHLDSSIQGDQSASRILSSRIARRLRVLHPEAEFAYRDLAANPLPHISIEELGSPAAAAILSEFATADIIVIGAPMYNFGIPTQLKAWFDHIIIAGATFSYGPEGVLGLAGNKRVIVAHTRGGLYFNGSPAAANEHAESHLRSMLSFIGLDDPEFITAEGTKMGNDHRSDAIERAIQRILHLETENLSRAA